jgi:NADH dehydrogenase FAD-containing subunit
MSGRRVIIVGGGFGGVKCAEILGRQLRAVDRCAVASIAIREHRLKHLPLVERKDSRKIVGCIRSRKLMACVFREMGINPQAQVRGQSRA